MGATNSSTMKNTITTNVVNDFMQNISTELETSNSAEMDLSQELQFNMPNASLDGCNIDISQRQNGTLKATLDVLADISDEQEAELVTQITNAQEQALDQANEDLAVGLDNEANTENEISQTVENSLRMSIEKTFTNMNYIRASGSQKAQIDLEGLMCIDSDITVDQNQQMAMVAENLSDLSVDWLTKSSLFKPCLSNKVPIKLATLPVPNTRILKLSKFLKCVFNSSYPTLAIEAEC